MNALLTRETARPGTLLSEIGGLPPIRGHAKAADANPPAAAAPPAPKPADGGRAQAPMNLIIRPSARDRWTSSLISQYTPQYVENICRGAMAGNLNSQWLMFELMEQTWPRLSKNLNELKNAVNDLEWNVVPFALKGQKPTPEAQRRARIIEYVIWNMNPDVTANENDFEDTVYDVLDALGKSIAVLEMDIPAEPVQVDLGAGVERIFPVKATRWVHPRYYGYPNYPVTADTLMLNAKEVKFSNPDAVIKDDNGAMWTPFPPDQFIISIIKQKSGHPINSGMFLLGGAKFYLGVVPELLADLRPTFALGDLRPERASGNDHAGGDAAARHGIVWLRRVPGGHGSEAARSHEGRRRKSTEGFD